MSKDRLEQFIDDHNEEFDVELPSLKLWGEIDAAIHPKPKKGKWQTASRSAAAIALFIVAGYFVFGSTTNDPKNLNTSPVALISEKNPEFSEMTEYYSNQINKNMSRLTALGHHDADLYRDIKQMELYYDTLNMEWAKNPHKSDEQLVNAMVENYRSRYMLLENVVNHLDRNRNNTSRVKPALTNLK